MVDPNTKRLHQNKPQITDERKSLAFFDPDRYELHKGEVAIIMGHFFVRYLNLLYREFEGDLLSPIVLGEIAHHNILKF